MTEAEFKNLQFQSTQANKISGITSKSILLPGIQLHHHFPSLLHIILGLVNYLDRVMVKFSHDKIELLLPHIRAKMIEVEEAKNAVDVLLAQERLFVKLIIK